MIHGHKKAKKEKTEQQIKDEDELSLKINNKLAEFFGLSRKEVSPTQIPKYLEFISLLMQLCTDIPTIFNFRRQLIIKTTQNKTPQEIGQLLGGEIKLTTKLIQSDPKSYTIWSYRQWLVKSLFQINPAVIKAEKELIKMLHIKDEKNFHVWNYRNWLNSIQNNIDEELSYTQDKIKSNPFNFSPYHFRTKYIHEKYLNALKGNSSEEEKRDVVTYGMPKALLDEEFQSVKTAIFLNPNEEAPWLYYNWLLGQLVPAFVVSTQTQQNKILLSFNMKVSNFASLLQGDYQSLKGIQGKSNTQTWEVQTSSTIQVRSNLSSFQSVATQSTSKLFLGSFAQGKWLEQHIKSIFHREIAFIDEVIESEEKVCRFAYLQKASVYKLILQLGTTSKQHQQTIEKGASCLKSIEQEPKAKKYTLKQLQYWLRLKKDNLTLTERSLRSIWD